MTAIEGETGQLYGLDAESRQMVIDTVHQLRERLLTRETILDYDRREVFPEDVIRQLLGPDIGLQLLFIPEEYGGMGGGARDCCAVTREMSKICLGIGTAFFAIQLGTDPLLVGGTEEQKENWLGAIAEGDKLVAYAVTEPEAGSNVVSIKTTAEPVKGEGEIITGYRLNGSKQFISNGAAADIVTVLASTPEGTAFFIVEKGTPGFSAGKSEEKHGIRASMTSPLTLDDVYVPAKNLIGEVPGNGYKQASQVFGYTRLMVAAMSLGAGEAAMNIAVDYSRERIQFGSPLCEKQGYTHKLIVPHLVRFIAAAAYIDEVAHRIDSGELDLQVEGAIAKLFTTEAANRAADDAIQALGGYGYIHEFEVEKIKRDIKITCIYEGTSEIQQNIISTFRWKTSRKSKGAFYADKADEMESLHADMDDAGCDTYAVMARAAGKTIDLVHENKLTRQQMVMFLLADIITRVEIGIGLARKAKELSDQNDPQAEKTRIASRIFASESAMVVFENILKIVQGTGSIDGKTASAFLDQISLASLLGSADGIVADMDRFADMVYGRK